MGGMHSMELERLGWGPDQLSILAEALPFAKELRRLVLEYNLGGPKGAAMLAKTLPQCQRLQTLFMPGAQNDVYRSQRLRKHEIAVSFET